jgi:hypothetical protein
VLIAARKLYKAFGLAFVASKPYHGFGQDLISETWNLQLRDDLA